MRILLTSQYPLWWPGSGLYVQQLARGLEAAGHSVRVLAIDDASPYDPGFDFARVSTGSTEADLPFAAPVCQGPGTHFSELDEARITTYREALRRKLDEEVDQFNPHLIHGHHIWLLGELILETGVPYVLSAYREELRKTVLEPRFAGLVAQGAENAGRLIVGSHAVRERLLELYPETSDRVVIVPPLVPEAEDNLGDRAAVQHRLGIDEPAFPFVLCLADGWDEALDLVLNAAARYEMAEPAPRTLVLGRELPTNELAAQARQLQLRYSQFRKLTPGDLQRTLPLANVVIVPTLDDAGEAVARFATTLGVPVVTTDSPSARELFPAAEWAPEGDHELLAEAVLRTLERQTDRANPLRAAQAVEGPRDAGAIVGMLVAEYEAVLRARFNGLPQ